MASGIKVITIPDQRWARPDIKSVALLPNALGKKPRRQAGAFEAWQVDRDGNVTEGTSSNAWIVTTAGEVVTRQADQGILNGVTRLGLLRVIAASGLRLGERPFSVAEAKAARRGVPHQQHEFRRAGGAHRRRAGRRRQARSARQEAGGILCGLRRWSAARTKHDRR